MPEELTKMKPPTPENDADLAAGIEDEMRAQMLLKDPKMLENYLRVGFKVMMERMPPAAEALKGRESRIDALVQETRLRLTALAKSAPEEVKNTLKMVEIMMNQLGKRTAMQEENKKQDLAAERLLGVLQKDIWGETMEQAHQGKKE
ncbi:MAG: hypothetical protein AAB568_00175 [Patescibacteria group bacterium]